MRPRAQATGTLYSLRALPTGSCPDSFNGIRARLFDGVATPVNAKNDSMLRTEIIRDPGGFRSSRDSV